MAISNPLRRLFADDEFVPLAAVFPQINIENIARDAELERKARENAEQDLPPKNSTALDAVEIDLMERIGDLRRRGLENYHRNREVYQRRINQVQSAHAAIRTAAGSAIGDFQAEVRSFRGGMVSVVKDLKEWNAAVNAFRSKHRLDRPAFKAANTATVALTVVGCLILETALNGYLFAQRNTLGLLGGVMVALLVSIVNVTFSGLCGQGAKLVTNRNWILKIAGSAIVAVWIAFTLGYNLAVAHFRDEVERVSDWALAAEAGLQSLLREPFTLSSIESWLLMAWGVLIALTMFLKFASQGESYLGYSRVQTHLRSALDEYERQLDNALESLRDRRDQAIEELQDASEMVRSSIGDAIDALQGQSEIRTHLQSFLSECDSKLKLALQKYRDANVATRQSGAPERFRKFPTFEKFQDSDVDRGQKEFAASEMERISRVVDEAVMQIQENYQVLQRDFPDADKLIGLDMHASETFRISTPGNIDRRTPGGVSEIEAPELP